MLTTDILRNKIKHIRPTGAKKTAHNMASLYARSLSLLIKRGIAKRAARRKMSIDANRSVAAKFFSASCRESQNIIR
jgi:hypothetical protein